MTTLDDVALTNIRRKDPTVLLEVGSWKLVKHDTTLGHVMRVLLYSYIEHKCGNIDTGEFTMYYWYHLDLIEDPCALCNMRPPDEIMGLWKLHNMDYIQRGLTY